jgi:MOSC domain-containing protein YiiM
MKFEMRLQQELRRQRGWLCKVIEAGIIRQGERMDVERRPRRQLAMQHAV